MTTGSSCRPSNQTCTCKIQRLRFLRGRSCYLPQLFLRCCFPRIGDDLIELRHGQNARHPKLADNKGWRTSESERLGLTVVTGEDRVDRLGVCGEVARDAIDIDASAREQLTAAPLGPIPIDR